MKYSYSGGLFLGCIIFSLHGMQDEAGAAVKREPVRRSGSSGHLRAQSVDAVLCGSSTVQNELGDVDPYDVENPYDGENDECLSTSPDPLRPGPNSRRSSFSELSDSSVKLKGNNDGDGFIEIESLSGDENSESIPPFVDKPQSRPSILNASSKSESISFCRFCKWGLGAFILYKVIGTFFEKDEKDEKDEE